MYNAIQEIVMRTVREAFQKTDLDKDMYLIRCFYCDRVGHIAARCYARKARLRYCKSDRETHNVVQTLVVIQSRFKCEDIKDPKEDSK